MTPINACLRSLEMLQVTLTELVKKKKSDSNNNN